MRLHIRTKLNKIHFIYTTPYQVTILFKYLINLCIFALY